MRGENLSTDAGQSPAGTAGAWTTAARTPTAPIGPGRRGGTVPRPPEADRAWKGMTRTFPESPDRDRPTVVNRAGTAAYAILIGGLGAGPARGPWLLLRERTTRRLGGG